MSTSRRLAGSGAGASTTTAAVRSRELYFRVNTVHIRVLALHERREDIPALAAHLFALHGALSPPVEKVRHRGASTDVAIRVARERARTGHTIERAVLMATESKIESTKLGLKPQRADASNLDDMSLEEVCTGSGGSRQAIHVVPMLAFDAESNCA